MRIKIIYSKENRDTYSLFIAHCFVNNVSCLIRKHDIYTLSLTMANNRV